MANRSSRSGKRATGQTQPFLAESLERRQLFSALPTVKLVADVATASGITGANAQFEVSRTGSTAAPLKVYYHAFSTSTINAHEYSKLSGEVTIHGGESIAYIDVKPVTGLVETTNPTLVVLLTASRTYASTTHKATITVEESHGGGGGGTVSGQRYYVPVTIGADGYTRTNQPVDDDLNLTSVLSNLGGSGAIEDSSLKVEEVDSSGNVINANVPFEFDKATNYDATTNASGDLVLEMVGTTASSQTRYYRLYFDTQGTYTAPTFASQVTVGDTSDVIGDDSYSISTNEATYIMEKNTGSFSSIYDKSDNDWVSYNNTQGPAGTYRGLANMGVTNGTHPGQFDGSTTVLSSGPLKTVIQYTSSDNAEIVTWSFYANYAQCTVNQSNNGPYWFVYEGTPGGTFNQNDISVQSDGTVNPLSQIWTQANGIGNGTNNGQWVYFDSTSENRFLYLAQNTTDTNPDSYWDDSGDMTVFGFGRDLGTDNPPDGLYATEHLTAVDTFTIGLAENDTFSSASATINGQYRDVSVTNQSGQLST